MRNRFFSSKPSDPKIMAEKYGPSELMWLDAQGETTGWREGYYWYQIDVGLMCWKLFHGQFIWRWKRQILAQRGHGGLSLQAILTHIGRIYGLIFKDEQYMRIYFDALKVEELPSSLSMMQDWCGVFWILQEQNPLKIVESKCIPNRFPHAPIIPELPYPLQKTF